MAKWLAPAAALCTAAVLCWAPWVFPSLVWCGWLGVAVALALAVRLPKRAGLLCTIAMAATALVGAFYWAPEVLADTMRAGYPWGVVVFVPLVLWEAVRAALPLWLAARLELPATAAWFPTAIIAVVLESLVPSIFPWRYGYMQVGWPVIVQSVDLLGTEWATVLEFAHAGALFYVGAAVLEAVRSRHLAASAKSVLLAPPVWLCAFNLAYGIAAMNYWTRQCDAAPRLRVALVQVDPTYLGSADKLLSLTDSVSGKVDLVCWPESSGGHYHVDLQQLSDPLLVFQLSRDPLRGLRPWPNPTCPLLVGTQAFKGNSEYPSELYQSAILVDAQERIAGRYDKRLLMPFGEYVPAQGWVPGIERVFPVAEPVMPGREPTVLSADGQLRLGVMLCYEDIHPESARSLVQNSANLLCSLINGSSFHNPLTLRQHLLLAQLRAVECRRYLIRAAATGETCVVTPLGQVQASLPLGTPGVMTAEVALFDGQTLSCRLGNAFPWLCGLLWLMLVSLPRFRLGRGL